MIRNESALLEAAGELLREDPANATMPAIAKRARLSTATAYRYFESLDTLHRAYIIQVVSKLADFSAECPLQGRELLEAVLAEWLKVVLQYGPVMVAIRSRQGFLMRLKAGERLTKLLEESWGRPIRDLMSENGIGAEHFPFALALSNALFNSRELLDAHDALGLDDQALVTRMASVYCGALAALANLDG